MAQDDRAKARELLESLLKAHPKDRAGLHAWPSLNSGSETRGHARHLLPHFCIVSDGSYRPLQGRQPRLDKGEMDQAKASAEAMLKEYPDKAEGYRLMGRLLLQDGKYEEAATHLQKSIRIQPDVEAYFLLGQAFFNLGNLEMAVTQFQTILDANPRFAPARLFIGDIFLRQGRGAEALGRGGERRKCSKPILRIFGASRCKATHCCFRARRGRPWPPWTTRPNWAPSHYGVLLKKGDAQAFPGRRRRGAGPDGRVEDFSQKPRRQDGSAFLVSAHPALRGGRGGFEAGSGVAARRMRACITPWPRCPSAGGTWTALGGIWTRRARPIRICSIRITTARR